MTATNTIKASYVKYLGHCGGFPRKALETNTTIEYITRNDATRLVIVANLDKAAHRLSFYAYDSEGVTLSSKDYCLSEKQTYHFDKLLAGSIELRRG